MIKEKKKERERERQGRGRGRGKESKQTEIERWNNSALEKDIMITTYIYIYTI